MTHRITLLSGTCCGLLLAACSGGLAPSKELSAELRNPLTAELYYEALVDRMTELEIQKNPLLENADKKEIVDAARSDALKGAQEARVLQRRGTTGYFVSISEYVEGEALYLDDVLYIGPTFEMDPGASVHMFMTTAVDPRESPLTDNNSLDLGPVRAAYGAHHYVVPHQEDPLLYRTAVLWDPILERIHGFAQLNK